MKVGDIIKHPVNGRGRILEIHHEKYAHCRWAKRIAGSPDRSTVNLHVLEPSE